MALINSGPAGATPRPDPTSQEVAVDEYEVEINGVVTTLQLSDADAEARGLKKPAAAKAKTPANKAAAPQNKKADA